jgi:hypothetical protein
MRKKVDGQVIETWTFRRHCIGQMAIMQSGRSTTEPHAQDASLIEMTKHRFIHNMFTFTL